MFLILFLLILYKNYLIKLKVSKTKDNLILQEILTWWNIGIEGYIMGNKALTLNLANGSWSQWPLGESQKYKLDVSQKKKVPLSYNAAISL